MYVISVITTTLGVNLPNCCSENKKGNKVEKEIKSRNDARWKQNVSDTIPRQQLIRDGRTSDNPGL